MQPDEFYNRVYEEVISTHEEGWIDVSLHTDVGEIGVYIDEKMIHHLYIYPEYRNQSYGEKGLEAARDALLEIYGTDAGLRLTIRQTVNSDTPYEESDEYMAADPSYKLAESCGFAVTSELASSMEGEWIFEAFY